MQEGAKGRKNAPRVTIGAAVSVINLMINFGVLRKIYVADFPRDCKIPTCAANL